MDTEWATEMAQVRSSRSGSSNTRSRRGSTEVDGLDADLAAQDVLHGLGDGPSFPDEPARQGAAGGVGAVLDQQAQLRVCVGGPHYREDREVDRDSGAGELLQIGRASA